MTTQRTKLPGVGTQYDIETRAGRRISVVAHQDGRRFLGFYEPSDPDACQATVTLDADESASLAELLAAPGASESAAGGMDLDLVTERIPVGTQSPYRGRQLGETRARTRTGAYIVAVLRRTGPHPSPGPEFRLEAGDAVVAVGTREAVDALIRIISGT
jgi:TrkA domain protein